MVKKKKIIILIVSIILIFTFMVLPVSATTYYNFTCSKPQLQGNDCYIEFLTEYGVAGLIYVKAILSPTVNSTSLSIGFSARLSDNHIWIRPSPNNYSSNGDRYVISSCGLVYLDSGYFSTTAYNGSSDSLESGLYLGNIGSIVSIRSYNCDVWNIGVSNGDFTFVYGNDVNINNKLDTIIGALQGGNQQIIDNANQNSQQIQQNQNENTQQIIDNQNQLQENEKNEAQNQGQGSVNDVSNAIEDKSAGFVSAISNMVSSMSYNGTYCAWSFPALKLPAIDGIMPEIQLTEEKPIDFEFWVNKIPADVLLLVRSLLTISLIVYCFKELYNTISYVLTLKGGGNNE